ESDAHALAGTEGGTVPFWSPDGQWVAFIGRGHKLKKVNVQSGTVQEICDGHYGVGGAWSTNGTILFAPQFSDSLYRVSASGGDPVAVNKLDASKHESIHAYPSFLSDGKHFVFLARTTGEARNEIAVASLDGGPIRRILKADALFGFE